MTPLLKASTPSAAASTRKIEPLLDQLTDTRSQIARLVLDGPQRMTAEQYRDRIKSLEDQAEKFEAEISRSSDEFRAQSQPITLEAVQAAIPDDAALIEFASYRPFNPKAAKDDEAYGRPRYVAYVLRRQGEIRWKELGEAKAIDDAVARLRKALRDPKRKDVKNLARTVDRKYFSHSAPCSEIRPDCSISPEGELNLIPFAALVDERGGIWSSATRSVIWPAGATCCDCRCPDRAKTARWWSPPRTSGEGVRLKRRDRRNRRKTQSKGEVREESARSALKDFYFPPLPYAEREGEALRALLPDATLLTKRQATKAALRQIHSPRLLHIATHGFFLEDQNLTSPANGARDQRWPERALQRSNARRASRILTALRVGAGRSQ